MAKRTILLLGLFVALLSSFVSAYLPTQNIPIAIQMDYNNGTGAITGCSMNFSIYWENGTLINIKYYGEEIGAGLYANSSFKTDKAGDYFILANCSMGSGIYYTRGQGFNVGGEDNMIIAALILAPLLFGIVLIWWNMSLDEEHKILKMFLALMTFLCFYATLWIGTQSLLKFYDFPELATSIGDITFILTILFYIILAYYAFYGVWIGLQTIKELREKKKNY